jgi:acyl-CoA synthetase (AMP-forming)/AMP-acid ligase II
VDELHDVTLGDVLREHRRSRPQRIATVCGEYRATYPELDQRTNQLANALGRAGVAEGDLVLWLGQNCHRLLECLLGCAKVGAVFVPANWRQSVAELVSLLGDVQPKVVIWQDEEIGGITAAARGRWAGHALWLQHDAEPAAAGSYEAFLGAAPDMDPAPYVDPALPVIQLYTGALGETPSGAQLSHDAVLAQALMVSMLQRITEDTVYLNSGPMFHMATLMTTCAAFAMGGNNVMTRRVDAAELCRVIEAERCTYGFVPGPTAVQMTEVNQHRRYDLSSFRSGGGSPQWNEMITVDDSPWGLDPGGYGQPEVAGMLTFNALGISSAGSSGRPSPWVQVRIVSPDGDDVPDGQTGEIVARGRIVTSGYHDRADLNAERTRGGWWHTRDLGRREPDGSITFVARLTRLMQSGDGYVYPTEVEAWLNALPGVKESAVIVRTDPAGTPRLLAVVVRDRSAGGSATADELVAYCRARLAPPQVPSAVEFVDQLPRRGRAIDYDTLDLQFGGGGQPGPA